MLDCDSHSISFFLSLSLSPFLLICFISLPLYCSVPLTVNPTSPLSLHYFSFNFFFSHFSNSLNSYFSLLPFSLIPSLLYHCPSLYLLLFFTLSTVSVLAVKTKAIPAWDESLAARVRDGMTLQGTYASTFVLQYNTFQVYCFFYHFHCILFHKKKYCSYN